MSSGPIEFLGEEHRSDMPDTEYGGHEGLIQPEFTNGQEAHTELSASEVARIMVRYGNQPLPPGTRSTGELDEPMVDPATGRVIDEAVSEDVTGTGGKPSDMQKSL